VSSSTPPDGWDYDPLVIRSVFGPAADDAVIYATVLSTEGVRRGLLGPNEPPRLWQRHVLNCAAVAELIPRRRQVCDLGSGAGLPGIPVALARPDLAVDLVEPMQRRSRFLEEVRGRLAAGERMRVVRGRAPEVANLLIPRPTVVVARAVAPLGVLVGWALPLLDSGGELFAIRGGRAADEVRSARSTVRAYGGEGVQIHRCGAAYLAEPAIVVRVAKRSAPARASRGRRPGRTRER
jgi:16S rRNA (guanine527-N7)-methyltransferase